MSTDKWAWWLFWYDFSLMKKKKDAFIDMELGENREAH